MEEVKSTVLVGPALSRTDVNTAEMEEVKSTVLVGPALSRTDVNTAEMVEVKSTVLVGPALIKNRCEHSRNGRNGRSDFRKTGES
jgi:hypothetical protein